MLKQDQIAEEHQLRAVLGAVGFDATQFHFSLTGASWSDLHEHRKAARRAHGAIIEGARGENRDLNENEVAACSKLSNSIRLVSDEIDNREASGSREPRNRINIIGDKGGARGGSRRGAGGDDAEVFGLRRDERVADFVGGSRHGSEPKLTDLLKASINGDWGELGDFRSQQSTTEGAAGGFITPSYLGARIIDLSRAKTRVVEAGALTVPITGPTSFATVDGDPEPQFRAENADVAEGQVLLGSRLFQPHTLAVIVKSSIELIEDAPNADALIMASIAEALGLKLDKMCLVGDGIGKVLGIYNTTGIGRINWNGPLTSYAPLSSAVEQVATANAEAGDFIMAARTAGELDRLVDDNENPLQMPRSVAERRFLQTNQVPVNLTAGSPPAEVGSAIFTGQWESYYLAMRTAMTLEATRVGGDSFGKMQVWIRGYLRADAFAVRPDHFSVVDGITSPTE
ncbi:phage major capsid protein [Parvibaculum sp.]|uniref:phage major capsid protein n=1 Tax=Parvibaculum sp. TaxID=2024848 RepID=UPI003919FCE3